MRKESGTSVPVDNIISGRWSPRAFDPSREVSIELITSLCEAARWACSANNEQPWSFLWWDKFKDASSYQRAFNCLDEWNQKWCINVPLLFAVLATNNFRRNNKPNRWAQYDTGAAAFSLCLQATSAGLNAHQMGGFNSDNLKNEFNIPDDFTPMAMIAVGYYGNPDSLVEPYRERESADRERRPLEDDFHKFGIF